MPRITGRKGAIYLRTGSGSLTSADKIADTNNWSMELELEQVPCSIKGEVSETYAAGQVTTRITLERFQTTSKPDAVLARHLTATVPAAGAADWHGLPVEYRLEQIDGGAQGATLTGTGVIQRSSANAPRSLIADTVEILGTTVPVFS